jgi:hypothetical protein
MAKTTPKKLSTIADLTLDPQNVNKGTERGSYLLEHSLQTYGAGRSILVDREGRVIAGNKTLEQAALMDLPVEVVQTDGHKLVVVQRTDLDLSEKSGKARGLAIADNRSSEVGYEPDPAMLALHAAEMDLSALRRAICGWSMIYSSRLSRPRRGNHTIRRRLLRFTA